MKNKAIKILGIGAVVLVVLTILTPAVSARDYEIKGTVTALGEYDGSKALVTLDTNDDGNGNWQMDLHMSQEQYDAINSAKRDGKQVRITYHFSGGKYQVKGVQILEPTVEISLRFTTYYVEPYAQG